MSEEMPSPPYPAPDNAVLGVIVGEALRAYQAGDTDLNAALVYAAVHGWLEGHLEGEECGQWCAGTHRQEENLN